MSTLEINGNRYTQFTYLNLTEDIRLKGSPIAASGEPNTIYVTQLSDFPVPVANEITLAASTVYKIKGPAIDIGANHIRYSAGSLIVGDSPDTSGLVSSTTGALLRGTNVNMEAQQVQLTALSGSLFEHSSAGSAHAVIMNRVNGTGGSIGTFGDASGQVFDACFLLSTGNVGVDFTPGAAIGLFLASLTSFQTLGATDIALNLGTATFNDFRLSTSNVIGTQTAMSGLASAGNIAGVSEVSACRFTATNPLVGVSKKDKGWMFQGCSGVEDSVTYAAALLQGNLTAAGLAPTIPGPITNPVGTTWIQNSGTERASVNTATGVIAIDNEAAVTTTLFATFDLEKVGGGTAIINFEVYENGTPIAGVEKEVTAVNANTSITIFAPVVATATNTYQLYATTDSNDIIVKNAQVIIGA